MPRNASETEFNKNETYSAEKRKRKMFRKRKVSQNIMLTQALDPYETRMRWWEKEHVKYAFNYSPVKLRLDALMGSYIVRLTDRKYMTELKSRIRQNYQFHQRKRIQERQKMELIRMKQMILHQIVQIEAAPEEIQEYPIFQLNLYSNAVINELNRKKVPRKVKKTTSLYNLLYPDEQVDTEEDMLKEEGMSLKKSFVDGAEELDGKEDDKEIEAKYMMTNEEYESAWFQTDAVKELAVIQGIEIIYSKAQQIVGILYSDVDEGRYEKQTESASVEDKTIIDQDT